MSETRSAARRLPAEERRLAYVAVTRARTDLLLSTHLWGLGKKTLSVPSRFLLEIRHALPDAVAVGAWHPSPAPEEKNGKQVAPQNPHLAEPLRASWPHDPLGHRRSVLGSLPE